MRSVVGLAGLTMTSLASVPLALPVVLRSLPADAALRQRLRALGVRPGCRLEVVRRGIPGGLLHVRMGLLAFMLRPADAADMAVDPLDPLSPDPAPGPLDRAETPSPRPGSATSSPTAG